MHLTTSRKRPLSRYITVIVITAFTLLWILPLTIVIFNSMKTAPEQSTTSVLTPPQDALNLLANIVGAVQLSGIDRAVINSVFYALVGSSGAVIVASLAAYALTKLKVRWPFFWFLLIYSGTVFPFQMYLVPLFQLYQQIGLYDTRQGMLLFYTTCAIPFCLFVFRNYFANMPHELVESASLDGASSFQIYQYIILPMAKAPALILFLTQFTWIWNDLLFGQVLSKSESVRPIMTALAMLSGMYGTGTIPQQMAGAFVASLPTVILFLALRKYFMTGLVLTTAGE